MSITARRVLVAVLGLLPAVFTAASAAWWWSALPAMLPTHSDFLGRPDDFSSRTSTVAVLIAVSAAGSLVVVGACAWSHRSPIAARAVVAAGGFVSGLTAGIWVSIAAPSLLAPSPAEANTGWWLLVLVASGGWAIIARLLRVPMPARSGEELAADQDAPVRHVAPGEQVSWSAVIGPTWLTWVVAGALVLQVAVAVPATAPAVVVALVIIVFFARLEITVDHRGLRLIAGLVRLPLKRITLDHLARAEVVDLHPSEWGGWGYRIAPGRSALVLRGGAALVVTTTDSRRFAATVKDPATPAGLLNGLAAARHPADQAPPAS